MNAVRCAMTPMAESDRYAIAFLKRYFEKFGDKAPNDDEVRFLTMYLPCAIRLIYMINLVVL